MASSSAADALFGMLSLDVLLGMLSLDVLLGMLSLDVLLGMLSLVVLLGMLSSGGTIQTLLVRHFDILKSIQHTLTLIFYS